MIRISTWFNVDYSFLINLQVIWTLGVSMVVLAALVHLPIRVVAALGLAMIVLHNAFDGIRVVGWQGPASPVPCLCREAVDPGCTSRPSSSRCSAMAGPVVFVIYPLRAVDRRDRRLATRSARSTDSMPPSRRRALLLRIGLGLIAAFVGDTRHEPVRRSAAVVAAGQRALLGASPSSTPRSTRCR